MSIKIGNGQKEGSELYLDPVSADRKNGHIGIYGKSGTGKTHLVLHLIKMIAMTASSFFGIILFDNSGSFTIKQINNKFAAFMGDRLMYFNIFKDGLPINPFRRYYSHFTKNIETPHEAAARITESISTCMEFGKVQKGCLYNFLRAYYFVEEAYLSNSFVSMDEKNPDITKELANLIIDNLSKGEEQNPLKIFRLCLLRGGLIKIDSSSSSGMQAKLCELTDMDVIGTIDFNWGEHLYKTGRVTIFELEGFEEDTKKVLLELLAWDLWSFLQAVGQESQPFVAVFDECQLLSYHRKSPSSKILTEGRKFGYNAWFITQFLNNGFSDAAICRLENCATNFYFNPPDEEIPIIAKKLNRANPKLWIEKLEELSKGECIAKGYFVSKLNPEKSVLYPPVVVKIPNL